ncbi:MAG TPA: hypothetical protein VNA69_23810 [Thermoanaerobaculia bacterium]|nr:hypothetical protein [Thermoanaerobaculia bacterium]
MSWGAGGTIVYNPFFGDGIFVLRPDGSEPVAVTTLDPKRRESFHVYPKLLSDGKRFLYVIHTVASQPNEIWAGSVDGTLRQRVLRADALVGIARGDVYFMRDGAVYAQRLDEDDLRVEGEPRRVAQRVGFFEPDAAPGASMADDGALLYSVPTDDTIEWAWYDRSGRRIEKIYEDAGVVPRSLSRDGKKVAAVKFEASKGANDIYIVDLERGLRTRLTSGLSFHQSPVWSPAGDRVYFGSDRDGPYDIYAQAEDGTTPAVPVWKSALDKDVRDITPAGDALICLESTRETRNDIWFVPIEAPEKRRPLIATEADEIGALLSPDGQWIAFRSDRSGRYEAYVRRLEGGRTTQASTNGSTGFLWSADGSELIMRTYDGDRVAVPLTFSGNEATPGKPLLLFTPPRGFSIHAATAKGLLASTLPDPTDFVVPLYYDSAPLR